MSREEYVEKNVNGPTKPLPHATLLHPRLRLRDGHLHLLRGPRRGTHRKCIVPRQAGPAARQRDAPLGHCGTSAFAANGSAHDGGIP